MTRQALFLFLAVTTTVLAQGNADSHKEFPSFKIAGNLYYVGTADLAVYLINTPEGNILINSDFEQDLPIIKKSIEQLGFNYRDTKIILISHAHSDHDAATDLVRKETGAKLMVMDADVPEEESTAKGRPGAHVDRVLHDLETVELGGSKLVAHLTPGHTKGCTTWTMQVRAGARTLNVVIVGGLNVNHGDILIGNESYPGIAEDFTHAFTVLKNLPCDVFLGAHGAYFDLKAKYAKMRADEGNPFIDPAGYKAYITERDDAFRKEWERQKQNPGSAAP